MCLALLHIPTSVFLDSSPIEIDYAFKAFYESKNSDVQTQWEQVRTQIYFSYMFTPSSTEKVSYDTFRRDYLPFNFDEFAPVEVLPDEDVDYLLDYMKSKTGAF